MDTGALAAVLACVACQRFEVPRIDNGLYAECCRGAGICVPSALVSAQDAAHLGADSCREALLCAPVGAANSDAYVAPSCRSVAGVEGRCLPGCLPEIAAQGELLPTQGCPPEHRCAPCFDPRTGKETGSCSFGVDPGPVDPPRTFASCCGGVSRCVPAAMVPEGQRGALDANSCAEPGTLCVPDGWLQGGPIVPQSCRSIANAEGRCVPSCLPGVAEQAALLPRENCPETFVCAPCFDPRTGASTGACTIGNDGGPREAALNFASCCGGGGKCLPNALVPADQRGQLGRDACSESDALCVPGPWLRDEPSTLPSCRSIDDTEGRCLPSCLPKIASQAGRLPRASCAADELCAPCFDPIDGSDTGACRVGRDRGPSEPPNVFGGCCGGLGRCVSPSLVPADQRARLGAEVCQGGELCVPSAWIASSTAAPQSCRSIGAAEGRCLPSCLPELASQLGRLPRSSCEAGHVCAPCFDPVSGQSTAACSIGADPGPREPPVLFGTCCGELGRCVSRSLVAPDDGAQLGVDSCSAASDELCVPTGWAAAPDAALPRSCRSSNAAEGRCLPSCLPGVAAQAERLAKGDCLDAHLCVPCFDPVSGAATGACTIGSDPGPSEPARTFDACCAAQDSPLGVCVPSELLSTEQRSRLPADSCDPAAYRCVPRRLADPASDGLVACAIPRILSSDPGACLPACMVGSLERLLLTQETCAGGELCVSCSDLGASGITCGP